MRQIDKDIKTLRDMSQRYAQDSNELFRSPIISAGRTRLAEVIYSLATEMEQVARKEIEETNTNEVD
jgi:hypothetical protein